MGSLHYDEARRHALRVLEAHSKLFEKAILVQDIFGLVRVVFWPKGQAGEDVASILSAAMRPEVKHYWTGDAWDASQATTVDHEVYSTVWAEASLGPKPEIRIAERLRNRAAWLREVTDPAWSTRGSPVVDGPPIVAFYSFKGGVGRSTALASFAAQRARRGERVVVVDFDLDAPGVGTLLASDGQGTSAQWGVVDYLLEQTSGPLDLRDYYHACRRPEIVGSGEVLVFPAGTVDDLYLGKLARVDFDLVADETDPLRAKRHPLLGLLLHVAKDLDPTWILVDGRTGLAESSGSLLAGFAHLHVLFGTASEQSWQGLARVINRLGAERVLHGKAQAECLMVQTMVPADTSVAEVARARFSERSRNEFTDRYYGADPDDATEDSLWYVRDSEDDDAPHAPVAISYDQQLAFFSDLAEVAPKLVDGAEYAALADRIVGRFVESQE